MGRIHREHGGEPSESRGAVGFSESASEHAAASARAGSHLAPEQDALPRMEERWEDEIFARTRERGEL